MIQNAGMTIRGGLRKRTWKLGKRGEGQKIALEGVDVDDPFLKEE